MKFIHVSDVHLGIKPDEGKPWSEKRAQDIWDSFAEVIGAAVEKKNFGKSIIFSAEYPRRKLS